MVRLDTSPAPDVEAELQLHHWVSIRRSYHQVLPSDFSVSMHDTSGRNFRKECKTPMVALQGYARAIATREHNRPSKRRSPRIAYIA